MFDNLMLDRPGIQDNIYQTPTKQMVVLRGTNPVETISLPSLQTYYNNIQIPGREYGYVQVTHFDFPVCDSLYKTIGTQDRLFDVYIKLQPTFIPTASNNWFTLGGYNTQYDD